MAAFVQDREFLRFHNLRFRIGGDWNMLAQGLAASGWFEAVQGTTIAYSMEGTCGVASDRWRDMSKNSSGCRGSAQAASADLFQHLGKA